MVHGNRFPPVPERARSAARGNLVWTWLTAVAVVFILAVVFYGINAQRSPEGSAPAVTASAPATTTPPAAAVPEAQAPGAGATETTGQGTAAEQGKR